MKTWVEVQASDGDEWATVLLDIVDFERLGGRALSIGSHGYPQVWADEKVQTVHRWIFGLTGTGYRRIVDHVNRDKLDNRRSNLRTLTASESNLNRPQMDGEYVGVFQTRSGRWEAKFRWQHVRHYVGTFVSRDEARDALKAYRDLHGMPTAA